MWIREDLKDVIKQIFLIGDFQYERTENMYDEDLLILSDGNRKIAIEISAFDDDFYIYEVKNDEETYCRENFKLVTLCYEEGNKEEYNDGEEEYYDQQYEHEYDDDDYF